MPYSLNHTSPAARPRVECARKLRDDRERRPVRLLVAHEGEPDVDRRLHPLVEVEREGVGALEPAHGIRVRAEREEAADGPVDVQPQPFGLGEVGDGLEVVDGAGVDGARRRDDGERLDAGGPVGGDGGGEGVDVHGPVVAHRDLAQRGLPEPEQLDRLAVAAVHLGGGVDAEPAAVRHPVGAQRRADPGACGRRRGRRGWPRRRR